MTLRMQRRAKSIPLRTLVRWEKAAARLWPGECEANLPAVIGRQIESGSLTTPPALWYVFLGPEVLAIKGETKGKRVRIPHGPATVSSELRRTSHCPSRMGRQPGSDDLEVRKPASGCMRPASREGGW
jgi:hypothetical protein